MTSRAARPLRTKVLAAAATVHAFASSKKEARGTVGLQDPTNKFPKRRSMASHNHGQNGPANGSSPGHGETSYKESGRPAGRKALITGGDSGMGRADAIAYAGKRRWAINYYCAEELDAHEVIDFIKKEGSKAIAIPGGMRDEFCG